MTDKFRFWSWNHRINQITMFTEFWLFVILREEHVFHWSWWWLVAFQIGSVLSGFSSYAKIKKIID